MSRYGEPSFAQSNAFEVVTLQPPTTAAAATTSSTIDAQVTASVVPSLLYPLGTPVINNIDSLVINYVTPWPIVDLAVSCGPTTEDLDSFSFKADNREKTLRPILLRKLTNDSPSEWPLRALTVTTVPQSFTVPDILSLDSARCLGFSEYYRQRPIHNDQHRRFSQTLCPVHYSRPTGINVQCYFYKHINRSTWLATLDVVLDAFLQQ